MRRLLPALGGEVPRLQGPSATDGVISHAHVTRPPQNSGQTGFREPLAGHTARAGPRASPPTLLRHVTPSA